MLDGEIPGVLSRQSCEMARAQQIMLPSALKNALNSFTSSGLQYGSGFLAMAIVAYLFVSLTISAISLARL